ncbi:MAG TPA: hydrogenase maturation nickel metallochaperone HypA [Ignavibacteria bacterium]|nr:hydrogenase maturation nickel metallochaperone HypA [Ignavibacteria bacterium]HMQ97486.1 hydrogenase maturation nickel metallochaperone HypA [Ignavibacteria bacterium]
MHELSLAQNIIETVKQNVTADELIKVREVIVEVGAFSGVVADSLKFSFEAITSGTELNDAIMTIVDIPFTLKCGECGSESSTEIPMLLCSICGSSNTQILSGDELRVKELKLVEE